MSEVTHCPQCGKKLVATLGTLGRTELTCLCCDKVPPMQTEFAKWADGPRAIPPKAA
jgi:hypothetical protein